MLCDILLVDVSPVNSSSPSAALREGPGPVETTTLSIHFSHVSSPVGTVVCVYTHACILHLPLQLERPRKQCIQASRAG